MEEKLLFEKFRIIDCLKKDAFTSVCLAYHVYLEKKIILKTLDTSSLEDNSILERFKREAKILASLDHPNIIKVLDFGTHNDFFYISFEYFESQNLRKVILGNNINEKQKRALFIQLLEGLSAAHSHNVIHRDIKPENLLVNDNNELKIADFGLAMLMNETNVTFQYSIVGTPGYMSPEQIQGQQLTPLTDLFSTGVVVYELYASIHPFMGHDVNETLNNILSKDDAELNSAISSCPEEIKNIVIKLMSKNPKARYSSAGEILGLLTPQLNAPSEGSIDLLANKEHKGETRRVINPKKGIAWNLPVLIVLSVLILSAIAYSLIIQKNLAGAPEYAGEDSLHHFNINRDSITLPAFQENKIAGNSEDAATDERDENSQTADELNDKNKLGEQAVLKNNPPPDESIGGEAAYGKLSVECSPWAAVYIDSKKFDTTPLKSPVTLSAGEHSLVLIHPEYAPYSSKIHVRKDMTTFIKINLDTLMGFFDCRVYPWGEVYINGYLRGQTPFRKPLMLEPGSYTLKIRNPNYPDFIEYIRIRQRDTLVYKMNFETMNRKK